MSLMTRTKRAQSAVEYLILLGTVMAIVIGGWKYYMDTASQKAGEFYNVTARGIYGNAPVVNSLKTYP